MGLNSARIEVRLIVDLRSSIFLTAVSLISFSVFRFSYSYISSYKFFSRFTLLLFIFVLSIVILIFSANLIFVILGWDGLGVSSYLLVVYYGRTKSYNAGILTVMSNRLGDAALLFRIALILQSGSWNIIFYKDIILTSFYFPLLLSLGAFTKSAQIPFRAWLPAAIAAPTPVSSLVHSSTLVTAGVYLLFRNFSDLLFNRVQNLIIFLGIRTIVIARVAAINEKDIKKMVALSTLRQLGLIVTRLGCKWIFMRFFHLIIHAFFKAIIFISVGNLIHLSQSYQALKNRGSLRMRGPLNRTTLIIARIRLCGAPFAAAFFSKEPIVESALHRSTHAGVVVLVILSLYLTLVYRFRLLKLVASNYIGLRPTLVLNEEDPLLVKGILVLMIPSFTRGSILSAIIIRTPFSGLYVRRAKMLIFLRFSTGALVLAWRKFRVYYTGQFRCYPMWSLTLFTASLFNFKQQPLSWWFSRSNFRLILSNYISSIEMLSVFNTSLISTQFIIRSLSIIPLFIRLRLVL